MKKYYFLFIIVLLSNKLTYAADFFLSVKTYQKVTVQVNSQTQTSLTNYFQFYNLPGGYTFVKVFEQNTGKIIFQNNVNLMPNYQLTASLDDMGNMNVITNNPIANYNMGNNVTVGTINYGNYNYGGNGNYTKGNGNYGNGNYSNGSYGNGNYGNHNHGQHGNYNNNNNTDAYFGQFLTTMRNESMDANKLKVAKEYVQKNQLSADQIKQIAKEFSFDSYRLDFAKAAYANCYDKGNYFLLKDVFSFSSNYNSLVDYISK